jgi:hypothetical protein
LRHLFGISASVRSDGVARAMVDQLTAIAAIMLDRGNASLVAAEEFSLIVHHDILYAPATRYST